MSQGRYSISRSGYDAWLEDGHVGEYQDFIEKEGGKSELIDEINVYLETMSIPELVKLLKQIS